MPTELSRPTPETTHGNNYGRKLGLYQQNYAHQRHANLGASTWRRKAPVSFVASVCPSVDNSASPTWTDLSKVWYWGLIRKCAKRNPNLVKIGHFTRIREILDRQKSALLECNVYHAVKIDERGINIVRTPKKLNYANSA